MNRATLRAPSPQYRDLGAHIVADPRICGGRPTFRGTRVMVWQVLDQLAEGLAWPQIEQAWRGTVPQPAIAEAARLAAGTLGPPLPSPDVRPRRKPVRRRGLAPA